jgi:glycosyltransferase involved in cell wall biosynthesis
MKPSVALSMIVRDAGELLPACLESARAVADEMVIADTGSSDDTVDVATRLGARVFSIPWNNDFSAARNLALRQVRSDWVLILDADERLDPSAAENIPALLSRHQADAYQVTIRNYVLSLNDRIWDRPALPNNSALAAAAQYPAYVEHQNVRLFRNDPEIHFVGRVHESAGPRILKLGKTLAQANFLIHHFGLAASEETRARKNLLYRELGRQKIRERPRDAQAHLELGLLEMDNFANFEEARRLFARACELDRRFALAQFFLGVALSKLGQPEAALPCFGEAERLGLRTALVAEFSGDAWYNAGQFSRAAEAYKTAAHRAPSDPLLESKLGLALVRSGRIGEGLRLQRGAIRRSGGRAEVHDRLILSLVWLERIAEASDAAQAKLGQVSHPTPSDFLRAAALAAKAHGNKNGAVELLSRGVEAHPEDKNLFMALQELLGSENDAMPVVSVSPHKPFT